MGLELDSVDNKIFPESLEETLVVDVGLFFGVEG